MMNQSDPLEPVVTAEQLALISIAIACESADRYMNELVPCVSKAQQKAFLKETIFFHHFMTVAALFYVFHHDLNYRNAYCDRMVASIHSGIRFPPNEELGLSPLSLFSEKDRDDAITSCFFSPANIVACLEQELYIGSMPSESELKVMNLKSVREMTGWDSPSANAVQYFAAALVARLTTALEIDPQERFLDFMNLSIHATAESKTAFKL